MRAGWGWVVVFSVLAYSATLCVRSISVRSISHTHVSDNMSLFKFGFSSSENRESSSLSSRKRPSDALTEEKTKERKKKYDQETRNNHFRNRGKNREWLIYNEEKNTMHC